MPEAITSFAHVAARLADPFADRAAVLAELGMNEASWRDLERSWLTEIQRRMQRGDRSLTDAFARAFATERERLCQTRAAQATAAQAPRPQPSLGPIDVTAAATPALEPALPFRGSAQAPPLAAARELCRTNSPLDETALLDEGALPGHRLPFEDP